MTRTDATLDALLAAVLAAPDDDLPRLMYADRLEETAGVEECSRCKDRGVVGWDYVNGIGKPPKAYPCPECTQPGYVPKSNGHAERAEFIRLQCELEPIRTHGHGTRFLHGGDCQTCFEAARLTWLERSALEDHGAEWFGPTACLTPPNERELRYGEWRVIRRGFVESVTCDLATLFGGPCENCGGFGEFRRRHDNGDGPEGPCPDCGGKWNSGPHDDYDSYWDRGTGTTPGVAPALFASQPVTRVTLSDREPVGSLSGWWWCSTKAAGGYPHAVLPDELFYRLPGVYARSVLSHSYPTRDAALDALSAACVAWGRSVAAGRWWGVCESCDDYTRKHCPACDGTGKRRGLPPLPARPQ